MVDEGDPLRIGGVDRRPLIARQVGEPVDALAVGADAVDVVAAGGVGGVGQLALGEPAQPALALAEVVHQRHRRSHRHHAVELVHLAVPHADAARGDELADELGLGCAVYTVGGAAAAPGGQAHPEGAQGGDVRAAHMDPVAVDVAPAAVMALVLDGEGAYRRAHAAARGALVFLDEFAARRVEEAALGLGDQDAILGRRG